MLWCIEIEQIKIDVRFMNTLYRDQYFKKSKRGFCRWAIHFDWYYFSQYFSLVCSHISTTRKTVHKCCNLRCWRVTVTWEVGPGGPGVDLAHSDCPLPPPHTTCQSLRYLSMISQTSIFKWTKIISISYICLWF